ERFGDASTRAEHADELDALVAAWIAERDRDDVVRALLDARIPVSPVNDVRDVLADAHVQARGSLVEVAVGDATITVPAPLPRLSGSRRTPTPAPALDADREAVLADWLG